VWRKDQRQTWYAKNKDRVNAARRAITGERRERKLARNRKWYANMSPERRAGWSAYMYTYGLRRRFKISLVRWLSIFAMQGQRCACCRRTDPGGRRWHTDHDHTTGEIRGIVCNCCNTTLGKLGDTLANVVVATTRLVSYLERAS
jgi:Autographiviridae endonuclease VII